MDTKLYKQIVKDISDKIISGELEPGSRLPSENELMDIYNASKSTIEKSMMILAHEGYILTIPRKGNYITRPALDHFSLHYREDELLSSMFAGLNDFDFSITPVGSELQSLVIKKTFDVDKKNMEVDVNEKEVICSSDFSTCVCRKRYGRSRLRKSYEVRPGIMDVYGIRPVCLAEHYA